ncbi:hypothetical protein RUND412_004349 [Rhizina undulata]
MEADKEYREYLRELELTLEREKVAQINAFHAKRSHVVKLMEAPERGHLIASNPPSRVHSGVSDTDTAKKNGCRTGTPGAKGYIQDLHGQVRDICAARGKALKKPFKCFDWETEMKFMRKAVYKELGSKLGWDLETCTEVIKTCCRDKVRNRGIRLKKRLKLQQQATGRQSAKPSTIDHMTPTHKQSACMDVGTSPPVETINSPLLPLDTSTSTARVPVSKTSFLSNLEVTSADDTPFSSSDIYASTKNTDPMDIQNSKKNLAVSGESYLENSSNDSEDDKSDEEITLLEMFRLEYNYPSN